MTFENRAWGFLPVTARGDADRTHHLDSISAGVIRMVEEGESGRKSWFTGR